MRRDEVIRQLRALAKLRTDLQRMEAALDTLTEDERDIIETMLINPRPNACDKMCEKLLIERAAVYRRRNKALKKLGYYLSEMRDKSETTRRF